MFAKMNGPRILITGGAGFIGSNTAEYFINKGYDVTVLDNLSRKGSKNNLLILKKDYPMIRFVKADIRTDIKLLEKETRNTDYVIHLAAQTAMTSSIIDPRYDFESNALGTFNVLEAARKSKKTPKLIFSSTNKVYGQMEDVKVTETQSRYVYKNITAIDEHRPIDFHSPYGCSKGCADQYVRDYYRIYGLPTVVFRQSCIYGPRQFGIEDQGWVAWFAIAASLNLPLTLYGDGKQVRDVLFVKDLVRAYELALKSKKTAGQIYNIGGGPKNTLSLLELISILEKLLSKKISYKFGPWRAGDQKVYISDIRKAEKHFSWKPSTSPQKGVKIMLAWIKQNISTIQESLNV
ncbi:MAG: GDP-mannose 4,6-dehydratase [Candidatus Woesearchaeota archaeon]